MNLTEEIKSLIFDYIDEEYKKYLKSNGILLIKKENINKVINNLYDNNNKNIKSLIRKSLKEKYMNDYPSGTVENMIFDIFQDKDLNINKITDELNFIQKKNYKEIEIPIISMYGKNRIPSKENMQGIDIVVFDILCKCIKISSSKFCSIRSTPIISHERIKLITLIDDS